MTWIKRKNGTKASRLEAPEQLQEAIGKGQLRKDDLIASNPDGPWRPLSDVKGLSFPKTIEPPVMEWRTDGDDGVERKRQKADYELNSHHEDFEIGAGTANSLAQVLCGGVAGLNVVACLMVILSGDNQLPAPIVVLWMIIFSWAMYVTYTVSMVGVNFMRAALKYLKKISDAEHGW